MTASLLRVGVEDTLVDLRAGCWASLTDHQIGRHLYPGLVGFDPAMAVVPALAESWSADRDGREWTFTLRPGAAFHDGVPVTAPAVAADLESRVIDLLGLGSLVADVRAEDPRRVRLRLARPFSPFLDRLASPAGGVSSPGGHGAGAYRLGAVEASGRVRLVRAADGGRGATSAAHDEIVFSPMADGNRMWDALLGGEVDLIAKCPYDVLSGATMCPPYRVASCLSLAVNMLVFNVVEGPFADVAARRAVAAAIDREELLRRGNRGVGAVPQGPISPASRFFSPRRRGRPMPALPWPARPFTLSASNEYDPAWLELLGNQFRRAGFQCDVRRRPFREHLTALMAGDFEAALTGMGAGSDPDQLLSEGFSSSGTANVARTSDEAFDRLLESARAETAVRRRRAIYRRAEGVLAETVPAVFLRHGLSAVGYHGRLGGVFAYPDNLLRLERVRG